MTDRAQIIALIEARIYTYPAIADMVGIKDPRYIRRVAQQIGHVRGRGRMNWAAVPNEQRAVLKDPPGTVYPPPVTPKGAAVCRRCGAGSSSRVLNLDGDGYCIMCLRRWK